MTIEERDTARAIRDIAKEMRKTNVLLEKLTADKPKEQTPMKVRIKKLHPDAVLPKRATSGAAGYDLYLPCDCELKPGRQRIPLGLAIELPQGYEAKIEPRSGYSTYGMEAIMAATTRRVDADVLHGKVDCDYRGEICLIIHSREILIHRLWKGQRIAQMTIYKAEEADFELTDTLTPTDRGQGGFGSTGA